MKTLRNHKEKGITKKGIRDLIWNQIILSTNGLTEKTRINLSPGLETILMKCFSLSKYFERNKIDLSLYGMRVQFWASLFKSFPAIVMFQRGKIIFTAKWQKIINIVKYESF